MFAADEQRHLRVTGQVQGVGFRPFVYRLAQQFKLHGWVQNQMGQVEILVQGEHQALRQFEHALQTQAPPLAQPLVQRLKTSPTLDAELEDFQILPSQTTGKTEIHLPPDYFVCPDCLRELHDPQNRRYRYPFINCTQCGPRYTLITRLPYDRPNTTMADFPLCPDCEQEYRDPSHRRFHAQPIACPVCGPQLQWRVLNASHPADHDPERALQHCVSALKQGAIVVVKGIGGYHLMCDAHNHSAIQHLRQHKPRPHKPLALMFPEQGDDGLHIVREHLHLSPSEATFLTQPMRPILLLKKRANSSLSPYIAPHLQEIGAFLPYSPLHDLLLNDLGTPLVVTSANLSGEPVLTDNAAVEHALAHITPYFLHHNRPIQRPADDPVFRFIAGHARPLRLGRGCAPLELPLKQPIKPLLAVGAQMKNTVALAWNTHAVISPHIGELSSLRSYQVFQQVSQDLQALYQTPAQSLACDAHPGYRATRWAQQSPLPTQKIGHHFAHASALYGEHQGQGDWLVFTWDGVGLGDDGDLWGGDTFWGQPGQWQRVARLCPFRLPGGEKAGRQPWRSALGICWAADLPVPEALQAQGDLALLRRAWEKQLNCPQTTAAGRLFDAAASLCGVLHNASFEGQGPMYLEALCDVQAPLSPIPVPWKALPTMKEAQWQDLMAMLISDHSLIYKATVFHLSLAHAILDLSQQLQVKCGVRSVGLCGGVFQNRVLTEWSVDLLQQAGFTVYLPEKLPSNDAALSFGQVVEAASQF